MSYKHDLFSVECEVPGLLRLTPIPGYAGTFPVRGESKHKCNLRCCKTVAVIYNPKEIVFVYMTI